MKRAVTFSVVPRRNPRNPEAEPQFYAQAQASGEMDIRTMSKRIEVATTVTRADVMAVLIALEDVIIESLHNGEIVRLGDLGTFQIGLNSGAAIDEKSFDSKMIKKAHINFRPGIGLVGALTNVTYAKVPSRKKPATPQAPDPLPVE